MAEDAGTGPALGFALVSVSVIFALHALYWQDHGSIPFALRADYARRWSAEIEYSDENPDKLLQALAESGL